MSSTEGTQKMGGADRCPTCGRSVSSIFDHVGGCPDEERRAGIAEILETVAKEGLHQPRDLDVALDAILALDPEDENIVFREAYLEISKIVGRQGSEDISLAQQITDALEHASVATFRERRVIDELLILATAVDDAMDDSAIVDNGRLILSSDGRDAIMDCLTRIAEYPDAPDSSNRPNDRVRHALRRLLGPRQIDKLSRAAQHAERNARSMGDTPDGWARVTPESHPLLHEMFCTIVHDGGGGADHPWYNVPPGWAKHLRESESSLLLLSREDRETLAIGERSEQEAITNRVFQFPRVGGRLKTCHAMLNAFFEDFIDNEDGPDEPPVVVDGNPHYESDFTVTIHRKAEPMILHSDEHPTGVVLPPVHVGVDPAQAGGERHAWTWTRDGKVITVTFLYENGVPHQMQLRDEAGYRLVDEEKKMDEFDWEDLSDLIMQNFVEGA